MFLLAKIAFHHGRRVTLLSITFLCMFMVSMASNMEMLSIGVITSSGPEFFSLFGKKHEVTVEEIEKQLPQIAENGVVTMESANHYRATQRDRNPLKEMMNRFERKVGARDNLIRLAVILVLIATLKGISLFGSQYLKQLVMIRVSRDMRRDYFEHIHKLPLEFYAQYNVGSLSSRVQTDAMLVAHGIYSGLTSYIQTPIAVVISFMLCLLTSVKLSMLVFIGFPIVMLPIMYFARKVKKVSKKLLQNNEALSSVLIECLSGIQTIKLFAREKFSIGKFREQNDQMAFLEAKSARYGFMARPILHIGASLMLASIMLTGLYWAHLSVSEILVFCGLVFLMYEPIKRLNDELLHIQKGVAAAERMYEVLEIKPPQLDHADAVPFQQLGKSIEFDKVSFGYGRAPVLKDVSFAVNRGELVAIVGPTGAGKSTLVNLLPRLYDPQGGEICIDGKPLASYTHESLRQQIAFVPQKPFFFLDTVASNIAFGGDYSREEIVDAAQRAHAEEFVLDLPDGYDTVLNERAKDLSGGQQQRLAIARALIRKASILVLDEATSSLDAVSEHRIKEAISALRGQVTQIVIAHRLSTIDDADRIIFLDQGRVTAQGTREELLETCPGFAEMWNLMHMSQV